MRLPLNAFLTRDRRQWRVPLWHKCEVPRCPLCRRYWGKSGSDSDIAKLTRFDPLQTTGFRSAATRRPRPRRSSISPNGQNQAVKETPEQIVAQLNGRGTGRRIGRANECANEEDGAPREVTARRAPPIAAICFQAVGRGPPPIRSAPPAAMPRHCHRGT
jgi:hypothetical protein